MTRIAVIIAVVIALAPVSLTAQVAATPSAPPTTQASDRAAILKVAAGVMERARYCTLVTVSAGGHPQARIMDAFAPEPGMAVWMATTSLSRKVGEIRADPRVTLSYFDAKTMGYVTLIGRAALVTDPAEKAKRWKDDWAEIYADRNRGDDYLLIRVTPIRLEVSAEAEGVKNDPKTWRAAVVEFR